MKHGKSKKLILFLLTALVLLCLTACGAEAKPTISAPQPFGLEFGMTRGEVIAKLGDPAETLGSDHDNYIIDQYSYENDSTPRPANLDINNSIPSDGGMTSLDLDYTLLNPTDRPEQAILSGITYEEYHDGSESLLHSAVADYADYLKTYYGDFEEDEGFYSWELKKDQYSISVSLCGPDEESCSIWLMTYCDTDEMNNARRHRTCHICGADIENLNYYTVKGQNSDVVICKDCRTKLILHNGYVIIDGEKVFITDNINIMRDGFLVFTYPKDYEFEEKDENSYSFRKKTGDEESILFLLWDDGYRTAGLDADRELFSLGAIFANTIDPEKPETLNDFYDSFNYLPDFSYTADLDDRDDGLYVIYNYDNGATGIVTVKDGITYFVSSANNYDPNMTFVDTLSVDILFPAVEAIEAYYESK